MFLDWEGGGGFIRIGTAKPSVIEGVIVVGEILIRK